MEIESSKLRTYGDYKLIPKEEFDQHPEIITESVTDQLVGGMMKKLLEDKAIDLIVKQDAFEKEDETGERRLYTSVGVTITVIMGENANRDSDDRWENHEAEDGIRVRPEAFMDLLKLEAKVTR